MKNRILKLFMILALGFLFETTAKAQVIRERPRHDEIEVRPAQPSPRHVWRSGEWAWRGGAYVWSPGIWIVPERGRAWRPGHWRRVPGGEEWVPGHWR